MSFNINLTICSLYGVAGSPRVEGDDEEDDVDDLDNEFNYTQGNGKAMHQWQLQGHGEDVDLSSSSRHEPQHCIPRLTNGQQVDPKNKDHCWNYDVVCLNFELSLISWVFCSS